MLYVPSSFYYKYVAIFDINNTRARHLTTYPCIYSYYTHIPYRKTTLAFVNHKCVDITDTSSAIEAQAREKFIDRWGGMATVISLDGTSDGEKGK